jgi:hypothetical protein
MERKHKTGARRLKRNFLFHKLNEVPRKNAEKVIISVCLFMEAENEVKIGYPASGQPIFLWRMHPFIYIPDFDKQLFLRLSYA